MKKEKINPAFLLFSAVLTAILFYFSSKAFFEHFWGFNLFSAKHWQHIAGKWQNGWVLHTTKEYLFFTALIASIPGYFIACFFVHEILRKSALLNPLNLYRNHRKKILKERSLAAATGALPIHEKTPKNEERTIRVSSQKMGQINLLRGKKSSVAASPSVSKTEPKGTSDRTAEQFDIWEKMAQKLEQGNAFVLRQMNIASVSFNLVAITQNALFLICEGPDNGSVWETAEDASPAVWKTENGSIPSPLSGLLNAKEILQDYLAKNLSEYPEISVNCCMILDHGHISNMDKLLPFLEDNNLSILKTGTCKTEALPDSDALTRLINAQPAPSQEMNDAIAVAILDLMKV